MADCCVLYIAKNFNSVATKCWDGEEQKDILHLHPDYFAEAAPAVGETQRQPGETEMPKCEHLTSLSKEDVNLYCVHLCNMHLTPNSLSFLRGHTLVQISASNIVRVDLLDFLQCLDAPTFATLQILSLRGIKMRKKSTLPAITALGRLKSLQHLQSLDISLTRVNNINCLRELKDNLRVLKMYGLRVKRRRCFKRFLSTILELQELRILDASHYGVGGDVRYQHVDRLCGSGVLPHLKELDINGNPFCLTGVDVSKFTENHPNLKNIGLVAWRTPEDRPHFDGICATYPTINIVGGESEDQMIKALRMYSDRPLYLRSIIERVDNLHIHDVAYVTANLLKHVLTAIGGNISQRSVVASGVNLLYDIVKMRDDLNELPRELLGEMTNIALIGIEEYR
ncbi:unnamed protein product [Hymenolepis diminuta]|uniref:Protein phosphatase 1 regulatory subunit 22 n=1 Tax=Hymenolepis diminuta TaxID=6216 RepID=A0A0R3SA53_HYMDI|nr:unnamed protein product [Hymenolepis diminuta]